MDYNKFEDRISDWIENTMDIRDRKEFEEFLSENPEYKSKVDSVRNTINIMKAAPSLNTSKDFDKKLQDRINLLSNNDKSSTDILGFSKQNFAFLILSLLCIFMLSAFLLQPSQSNYFIADENVATQELDSDEEDKKLKEVELLNDVNGSFVSDKD
tara:strand:- start:832 stop:1299 length:468 start_codon:yes stop_codon:yes gene_type:complete